MILSPNKAFVVLSVVMKWFMTVRLYCLSTVKTEIRLTPMPLLKGDKYKMLSSRRDELLIEIIFVKSFSFVRDKTTPGLSLT
jgi:hypothetical protein